MTAYAYSGRDAAGRLDHGEMEAETADAVALRLADRGITPVSIEPVMDEAGGRALKLELRRAPTLDDLLLFTRQMYSLTRAGVPITRALRGLEEGARNARFKEALGRIVAQLESGRELSAAMGQHPDIFSPIVINMVRVGESTGRLEAAFQQLSQYLTLEKDTRARVKQALRYPVFVLVAIVAAIAVINILVVPAFASMFEQFGAELPLPTRMLMAISAFTVGYWPHMLAGALLAFGALYFYVRTPRGRYQWDRLKLRIPVVGGIIHRSTLARFARAFSMTSASGVPILQALDSVAGAVDNEYVASRVRNIRDGLERGESLLRAATRTGLFTPLVLQMIAVGEETGQMEELMQEVAGYYEREVDYDLQNLSASIEPVLLVIVGAMVLILALGVFLPLWDLGAAALN